MPPLSGLIQPSACAAWGAGESAPDSPARWHPGTGTTHDLGAGAGQESTLNPLLSAGNGQGEIPGAWDWRVQPVWPEFILSSGFASRAGDLLGGLNLVGADASGSTASFLEFANTFCDGRTAPAQQGPASACRNHTGAPAGV